MKKIYSLFFVLGFVLGVLFISMDFTGKEVVVSEKRTTHLVSPNSAIYWVGTIPSEVGTIPFEVGTVTLDTETGMGEKSAVLYCTEEWQFPSIDNNGEFLCGDAASIF